MNTNNKIAKAKVDVRIILSALWGARVFSGLQGDSTRLHDPVALNELLTGTADIVITDLMFVILSAILHGQGQR